MNQNALAYDPFVKFSAQAGILHEEYCKVDHDLIWWHEDRFFSKHFLRENCIQRQVFAISNDELIFYFDFDNFIGKLLVLMQTDTMY